MYLRGLALFLLCLAVGARRSMRINDSHRDIQQQGNMLANGLEVSTEAEEALVPGVSWTAFRRAGPQTGALSKETEYRATSSRFGPRRTLDALMASSGTENDLNTASTINRRAVLRSVAALPIAAPVLAYDTAPDNTIDVAALEKARAEKEKQNKKNRAELEPYLKKISGATDKNSFADAADSFTLWLIGKGYFPEGLNARGIKERIEESYNSLPKKGYGCERTRDNNGVCFSPGEPADSAYKAAIDNLRKYSFKKLKGGALISDGVSAANTQPF